MHGNPHGWGAPPGSPLGAPPPGGPFGGMPAGGYGQVARQQGVTSIAWIAMGLAIASWVGFSCLTAIPALIFGHLEVAAGKRGERSSESTNVARIAFWIALLHFGLIFVVIAVYAVFALFLGAAMLM